MSWPIAVINCMMSKCRPYIQPRILLTALLDLGLLTFQALSLGVTLQTPIGYFSDDPSFIYWFILCKRGAIRQAKYLDYTGEMVWLQCNQYFFNQKKP